MKTHFLTPYITVSMLYIKYSHVMGVYRDYINPYIESVYRSIIQEYIL